MTYVWKISLNVSGQLNTCDLIDVGRYAAHESKALYSRVNKRLSNDGAPIFTHKTSFKSRRLLCDPQSNVSAGNATIYTS